MSSRASSLTNRLQAVLKQRIGANSVPGAVLAVANSKDLVGISAMGIADPGSERAMATDTVFRIASMTKPIASLAALQLVEDGELDLDQPLASLVPQLSEVNVLVGFDEDRRAVLRPPVRAITLRHLLTHTAGFGYRFLNAEILQAQGEIVAGSLSSLQAPLAFDPGDDWQYGISTDWLGIVIETVCGKPLGHVLKERIFDPLGMVDTSFTAPTDQTRLVPLLSRSENSFEPANAVIGGGDNAEFHSAGGGLYSSAADYVHFCRMLLNKGRLGCRRLLRPESTDLLFESQTGNLAVGRMTSIAPSICRDFEPFAGQQPGWSFAGLINRRQGPDGRSAGSLSWAGLANTYFWIDPHREICVVIMMQFLPFADEHALALVSSVERAIYSPMPQMGGA